jgi:hypothetical protein
VYISGLDRWADNDLSAAFEVTGTLVVETGADDPDGIGRHYVVKDATWERIS